MADIHKVAEQIVDFGERLSDVADAASGKGRRGSSGMTRWVLLPAAGGALYALVRTDFFARQAKGVVEEAKTRASELPNDLLKTVRETSRKSASRSGSQQRSAGGSRGQRRRRTSSARTNNSG
jgi:hypothetical protein